MDNFENHLAEGAAFHEKLAAGWSRGYESGGFRKRILFLGGLLGQLVRNDATWLDAGCGSGVLSRELSRLGAHVVAIDGSPAMIRQAILDTERGEDKTIQYSTIHNIEHLSFDSCFDGILCSSVIEYVENPQQVMRGLFRATKDGGYLVISVPNRFSPIRSIQKMTRSFFKLFNRHLFTYLSHSRRDYSYPAIFPLIQSCGFVVDRVETFDPVLPALFSSLKLGALFVVVAHK